MYFESEFNLWKTDGTTAGTTLISTEYDPRYMTPMNGKVYFSGYDQTVWPRTLEDRRDPAGTTLVKDISPGDYGSYPSIGYSPGLGQFAVLGGKLYFGANDGTNGNQLWSTDGTTAGTAIVDNLNPGSVAPNGLGAAVTAVAAVNGRIFFQANDGSHGGGALDEPRQGVGDLARQGPQPERRRLVPHGILRFGRRHLFSGRSPAPLEDRRNSRWHVSAQPRDFQPTIFRRFQRQVDLQRHRRRLRFGDGESDGTVAGTTLVKDINPAQGYSYYGHITPTRKLLPERPHSFRWQADLRRQRRY